MKLENCVAGSGRGNFAKSEHSSMKVCPATVLSEVFQLLENYGPTWYTQENHDRMVAALAQQTQN